MGTLSLDRAQPEQRARLSRFHSRLRQAARARGLTAMVQVSDVTGVSQASLCKIMGGDRLPSLPTLMQLADGLGVSLDWLCGYEVPVTLERTKRSLSMWQDAKRACMPVERRHDKDGGDKE